MFKRRNPYDNENGGPALQEEAAYPARPMNSNSGNYHEGTPPRIFERSEQPASYRSPAQAYPRHVEEAQDALEGDVQAEEQWRPAGYPSRGPGPIDMEEPETVLGEGISITGKLEFKRFLRVDGEFEGELDSDGRIVVGPTGVVRANINLREAIIEGRVEGDITVSQRLELRGQAKILGNIHARLMSVDEGVSISGQVTVRPADEESN